MSIKTIAFYGDFNFNIKFSELPDGRGVRVSIPNHHCEVAWGGSFPDHFVDALQRFMTDDDLTKIEGMVLNPKTTGFSEVWASD